MFVALEVTELAKLHAVAKRLYTEDRLNGDEMRDLAHTIEGALRHALDMPDNGVLVFAPKKCSHPGCNGSVEAVICCRSY